MAFRNVYIQNDVKLKIKNEQLVVMKDTNEYTIPLEDINSICIESQRTSVPLKKSSIKSGKIRQ